jgi:biotin carboxyl carrier protein
VICEDGGTVQKFLVEEKDTVNEGQVVAILSK